MNPCTKEQEIKELRDIAIENRTRFEYIQKDISEIKTNHLAHMQVSIEKINQQLEDGFTPQEKEDICKRVADLEKLSYKVLAWAAVIGVVAGTLIQLIFKYL